MSASLKSLMSSVLGRAVGGRAGMAELFPKTEAATDGEECLRDCEDCTVRYPRGFSIDEDDALYGLVQGWSTHLIVGTGKADWVRDVADEKGSVMEAVSRAPGPSNGKLMLSASNMPTPHGTGDYSEPTTVLLLPAFVLVDQVEGRNVCALLADVVSKAPTNTSPLQASTLPRSVGSGDASVPALTIRPCPHSAVVLVCSQKTRDARCGQSAPLLRKELERHLRPLGLYRDLHDDRPGGVAIYFISHVGGHKYSANVLVYRRPDAFGRDRAGPDVGAAQCIWLARVRPDDCENLVRYTILQGKVVKPDRQLRGGFDRARGLTSW